MINIEEYGKKELEKYNGVTMPVKAVELLPDLPSYR